MKRQIFEKQSKPKYREDQHNISFYNNYKQKIKKIECFSAILIMIISILLISSCGGGAAMVEVYPSGHKIPEFSNYSIKTLAFFPTRNRTLTPEQCSEMDRYLHLRWRTTHFVIWHDSVAGKLNNDVLLEMHYQNFDTYSPKTGVTDTALLIKIGELIGCDAIAQGQVFDIKQIQGSFGGSTSQTSCTVSYSLFSTRDGKLLSEESCKVIAHTATGLEPPPRITDVIKEGIDQILR